MSQDDLKAREVVLRNTKATKDTSVRVWIENAFGMSEKSVETKVEVSVDDNKGIMFNMLFLPIG